MQGKVSWRPVAGAFILTAAGQAVLVLGGVPPAGIVVVVALLFVVGLRAPAVVTWILLAAAMALLGTVEVVSAESRGEDHDLVAVVLLLALSAVAGLSMRYHRAFAAEAAARTEAAERGAEAEAHRLAAMDRLRIARDLHDSVAHHLAVVNLQATGAGRVLERDPETAAAMLARIQDAARAAIAETAALVGDLRRNALPLTPALVADAPLADLARPVEAAGGRVETDGVDLAGLPQKAQVTCYRLLMEALTNAARHAAGATVRVTLSRQGPRVILDVVNGPTSRSAPPASSGGHGLLGMRERVLSVGGAFTAGATPDGGFRVRAVLPVEPA
ncbi:Sensor histidine kinase DesK [Pseudoclavibacter triregionum]|nr:Sensor histidine kinase DesK [Pseudoclavibacter triregionum]